jgi:uncharacterized protein (TIGR03437 family)
LGGTSVKVTLGDFTAAVPLLRSASFNVIGVLPPATPAGEGELRVTYDGKTSSPVPITVVPVSFGLFSLSSPWLPPNGAPLDGRLPEPAAGIGPGYVDTVNAEGDRESNSLLRPAHPGQQAALWGTGLGSAAGGDGTFPAPGDLTTDVEVLVGGKVANVLAKRRSECCPGIDEIIIELPADVEGCFVPVAVRAAGITSNFVTISVAAAGSQCPDLFGLAEGEIEKLRDLREVTIGDVGLIRYALEFQIGDLTADLTLDYAHAEFASYHPSLLMRSRAARSPELSGVPSPGFCTILPNDTWDLLIPVVGDQDRPKYLSDAGPFLDLNGPLGGMTLEPANSGYFAHLGGFYPDLTEDVLPEYLAPGVYTIANGNGGQEVQGFRATLTVPEHLVWTNKEEVAVIPRTEDLTITWNSSDPERELVTLVALSGSENASESAALVCSERASAGKLTVPAWILSALPKSEISSDLGVPVGMLGVLSSPRLDDGVLHGVGVDVLRFRYLTARFRNVEFR